MRKKGRICSTKRDMSPSVGTSGLFPRNRKWKKEDASLPRNSRPNSRGGGILQRGGMGILVSYLSSYIRYEQTLPWSDGGMSFANSNKPVATAILLPSHGAHAIQKIPMKGFRFPPPHSLTSNNPHRMEHSSRASTTYGICTNTLSRYKIRKSGEFQNTDLTCTHSGRIKFPDPPPPPRTA